jgi:peptide/nickel transport system permease protein
LLRYIISRVMQAVLLLIGVSLIGFGLMHLAPGGPVAVYTLNPTVTAADLSRLKHQFGLDQPVPIQYVKWAWGIFTGNWGDSFFGGRPVLDIILERVPATVELMGSATLLAMLIGVTIGMLAAVRRQSLLDYFSSTAAVVALSLPTFWFGLIAIFVFALVLGWFPAGGMLTSGIPSNLLDNLWHLTLPMLVLAFVLIATWSRYARSAMLEVLAQDYMRTARAKGLSPHTIMLRHALRGVLVPMVTLAGLQLPTLFGGALVTETVFSWPGMGLLFVNALSMRDYPVLMGILMLTGLLVVVGNLLADLLVAWIDPRVKLLGER